jgi:predicted metal-dependent peptidase
MTMTQAMARMIKARVGLIAREPFFAHLAMSKLELVEDPKCENTWTDGRRMGFNPEYVMGAETIDQLEAVMAARVAACALGHPFRRGARDEKMWNLASAYCVNEYVSKAGFRLPQGAELDPRFDGMYVEQVFSQLSQEQPPEPPQGGGGASSGAGDQSSPGEGDGESSGSAPATGEVRDATSESDGEQAASEAERADQEADWQTSAAQAAQAAKGAGKLAGGAERLAAAVMQPRVDWREALQRYLRAKAKDDYTMRRPNRNLMLHGIIAPSLQSSRCGTLGFAIDYSASITQSNVDQFTAEVEDAREMIRPERVIVVIFDTGIRQAFEFGDGEPIVLPPVRGGGGTDFRPAVRYFNALESAPEVLVYLTDLDCQSFEPEPEYPVVWVSTRAGSPPYGEVILMY